MKKYKNKALWLAASIAITIIFLLPIISSYYLNLATNLIKAYPYAAPLVIFILRFAGAILAPLPAAPITFASLAVLPWWQALIYNFIGSTAGAYAAFFIARRFQEPAVAHFTPLRQIHQWQEKISLNKQFWAFAGIRLASVFVYDFVSYAAGLTKLSFKTFVLATFIIDVPINFSFFYLGGIAFRYSLYIYVIFTVLFILSGLLLKKSLKRFLV